MFMPGVVEVRGRLDWITSDSVYLRLTGASVRSGEVQRVPTNGLAAIARTPDILIQKREFSGGRTTVFILGATAVAAFLFALAFGISVATMNPG
jgi:hypothetical protein